MHQTRTLTEADVTLPQNHIFRKLPVITALLGVGGLVATFILGRGQASPEVFYSTYLVSFLFFLAVSLGGMFLVLIHFASRASWSAAIRRLAEHLMGNILLVALLAIPLLFGLDYVYPWIKHPVKSKVAYLNKPFFLIRAAFYLISWVVIAMYFSSRSRKQDETGDEQLSHGMQRWSAASLFVFALTVTFASFDWIMSTDPHWFSTIYGVYFFASCVIAVFAGVSFYAIFLQTTGALRNVVHVNHYHDMGKLMFGFTVFWTYAAFSQFMLIWYSNIPEETMWYSYRIGPEWLNLTYFLVAGHFVLPFFFLMSRHMKRNRLTMGVASMWLLAMNIVDYYWLVLPTVYHHAGQNAHAAVQKTMIAASGGGHAATKSAHGAAQHAAHAAHHAGFHTNHLLILVAFVVSMGLLYIAGLSFQASRANIVANKDPRLAESLNYENF